MRTKLVTDCTRSQPRRRHMPTYCIIETSINFQGKCLRFVAMVDPFRAGLESHSFPPHCWTKFIDLSQNDKNLNPSKNGVRDQQQKALNSSFLNSAQIWYSCLWMSLVYTFLPQQNFIRSPLMWHTLHYWYPFCWNNGMWAATFFVDECLLTSFLWFNTLSCICMLSIQSMHHVGYLTSEDTWCSWNSLFVLKGKQCCCHWW